MADHVLEVRDLTKHFPPGRSDRTPRAGSKGVVRAVDGVGFDLLRGETLALVGESGSGKTTTGRSVMRLIEPTGGSIRYRDRDGAQIDVLSARGSELLAFRRAVQMVYQDPYSYMNPRMSVGRIITEPLEVHRIGTAASRRDAAARALESVGLRSSHLSRYPHAFSGGQRQRIAIARAIVLRPTVVIADEPVSALDVSVQAQVLTLLQDLQEELGLTYLFIAHDLAVVRHLSNRIAVMYLGRIVEDAPTDDLFAHPFHPYTEALISAVPVPDPTAAQSPIVLSGDIPSPAAPPSGCPFHTRCRYAQPRCSSDVPPLHEIAPARRVACHFPLGPP